MSSPADHGISGMTGDEALPRRNGELVFEAPWEGRAFGLAVAMDESGVYDWADFRDRLVAETAADERDGEPTGYYQRWLRAWSGCRWTAGSSRRRSWRRGQRRARRPGPTTGNGDRGLTEGGAAGWWERHERSTATD